MTTRLRQMCDGCPWRDMATMREEFLAIVQYAEGGGGGFVCHRRMGPCDGPTIALKRESVRSRKASA